MTDSEKIDLILLKINSMEKDFGELKEDVSELKEDVSELKKDVSVLKQDVSKLKEDVTSLQVSDDRLSSQLIKFRDESREMDAMILDEVERVHTILERHKLEKAAHSA